MKTNGTLPLRWLAVLLGSFAFCLLIHFPIHWIIMLKSFHPDGLKLFGFITLDPVTLEYLAYALFNPISLIMASAYIAPSKQFVTAVVMASLIAVFVTSHVINTPTLITAGFYLRVGLNVLGCLIALIAVYENQKKNLKCCITRLIRRFALPALRQCAELKKKIDFNKLRR
ncbi:MAG: hypothetical protein PF904_05480 [Kiritimatiellae bacterium]|jgi:hypothetical protein|nr:hypothetical protein [Kiritimatiellia bacterium]